MLYKSWNLTVVSKWTKTCVVLRRIQAEAWENKICSIIWWHLLCSNVQKVFLGCASLECQTVTPQKLGSGLSIEPETLWGKDQNSIMQRAVLFFWFFDGPMVLSIKGKKRITSTEKKKKRLSIVAMWIKMLGKKGSFYSYLVEVWILWELELVTESITTHYYRKGYLWAKRDKEGFISFITLFFSPISHSQQRYGQEIPLWAPKCCQFLSVQA